MTIRKSLETIEAKEGMRIWYVPRTWISRRTWRPTRNYWDLRHMCREIDNLKNYKSYVSRHIPICLSYINSKWRIISPPSKSSKVIPQNYSDDHFIDIQNSFLSTRYFEFFETFKEASDKIQNTLINNKNRADWWIEESTQFLEKSYIDIETNYRPDLDLESREFYIAPIRVGTGDPGKLLLPWCIAQHKISKLRPIKIKYPQDHISIRLTPTVQEGLMFDIYNSGTYSERFSIDFKEEFPGFKKRDLPSVYGTDIYIPRYVAKDVKLFKKWKNAVDQWNSIVNDALEKLEKLRVRNEKWFNKNIKI